MLGLCSDGEWSRLYEYYESILPTDLHKKFLDLMKNTYYLNI